MALQDFSRFILHASLRSAEAKHSLSHLAGADIEAAADPRQEAALFMLMLAFLGHGHDHRLLDILWFLLVGSLGWFRLGLPLCLRFGLARQSVEDAREEARDFRELGTAARVLRPAGLQERDDILGNGLHTGPDVLKTKIATF